MNQSEIVKRIQKICEEFDCRVKVIGPFFARTEIAKALADTEAALAEKERELAELREKYEVFAPVCRKCGDPLTTDELICENCR